MRFEVPQFIEVEDKIFGPFTWKQFIYLTGGIGIALVSFFMLPTLLFALIGLPLAVLAGFLAFHRINNRPFSIFLESFLKYISNRKLYLWKKKTQQTVTLQRPTPPQTPLVTPTTKQPASTEKMSSLSQRLSLETLEPPSNEM